MPKTIERIADGLVAYVNDEMEPVAKEEATLCKVRYDDGRIVFFRPLPSGTNPATASSSLVVGAPVAKGFPDQPRDDHGRFGETGWSREASGSGPSIEGAKPDTPGGGSAPGNTPRVSAGEMARGPGPEYLHALGDVGRDLPSLTPYDTPEVRGARAMQAAIPQTADIATPERHALREQVANRLYGTGAATKAREAWIVLGPPAAGKSTVLAAPIAEQRGALIIDSDSAKPLIPEYANGNGAAAVHQESSDIVNGIVLARAMRAGDNVVLPLVGKTPRNITAIADRLQEQGYRVHALLNDLPPEQAAQRAVTRFEETGRFVDPNYVLNEVGTNPRRSYAALKTHAAVVDYAAYSNDVPKGQPPRLLESGNAAPRAARGRGGRGADSPNPRKPRFLDEVGDAVGQLAADIFPDWMSPDLLAAAHPDGLRVLKQQAVLPMSDLKGVGKHHIRALLVDADGRLLLLHWAKGQYRPADWAPVQGHIGDDVPDETPRQAAEREVLEETGYGGDRLVWHVLYPNCWVVQLPRGISAVPVLSDEHNDYTWLSPSDTAQWLAREGFYGQWAASLKRTRLAKQGPADPHLAALIVHGAQLGDWLPLAQAIAGDLGEAGAESTVQAFDALGVEDRGAFRVANTAASDWARHRAAILVRNVEERTRAGLRDIVTTALEEGWSPDELSSAITEDYLFSPERADLIATTELALAHSSGTLATWRATGQVAGKRNVLSPTHTDVDECDDNTDVGVIPLNEPFPSGDDGPPYHPRCRCVVVPALLDEAEKSRAAWDLAKYAPDQLRDPEGRFAYEGAGKQYTPKGDFAILTAANPGGQNQSAAANAKANQRLARDLRGRGFNPVAVTGHYTDTTSGQTLTEPSFLVSGLDAHTAIGLGGKYAQNSVITHQGLHDIQHQTLAPMDGFAAQPQDAYTQLPGGRKLTLNLNQRQNPIPDFAAGLSADWAERQMQGDTARLAEEDVAFDYISGPGLEHQATAAEVLGRFGDRFPAKKKVGPHWRIAIEFPPEAWRVMRSLHLKRKRTKA